MLWMLAGWTRAAIESCRVWQQVAAASTEICSPKHDADLRTDEGIHHQYARAAECVTVGGARSNSTLGEGQAHASQRANGGRPLATILCTHAHRQVCPRFPHHFTLASAGVAYITSRACDYYVFALRRILD